MQMVSQVNFHSITLLLSSVGVEELVCENWDGDERSTEVDSFGDGQETSVGHEQD